MNLSILQPPADAEPYIQFFWERPHEPLYPFPTLPNSARLNYVVLCEANHADLHRLFAEDPSPFVDRRFVTAKGALAYARDRQWLAPYQGQHGGRDWLFYLQDGTPAGVLHLYDLSRETIHENHRRAWVGYAVGAAHRQQGFAGEALPHMMVHLFAFMPGIEWVHAETQRDNSASLALLRRTGFRRDGKIAYNDTSAFFTHRRRGSIFAP